VWDLYDLGGEDRIEAAERLIGVTLQLVQRQGARHE
jgi:hypothetical protein